MDLTNGKDRNGGNPYFPKAVSQYDLEIVNCREQNGFKGLAYVVSFKVDKSNNPAVIAGEEYDWYVRMATPEQVAYAIPDVRNFLQAVLGLKTPEEKKAHEDKYNTYFKSTQSAAQPFRGKKVRLSTSPSASDKFTKHFFMPKSA